ncbi:MAG: hypothetical protein ACRENP_17530 [Longimicrobiales bacterium]
MPMPSPRMPRTVPEAARRKLEVATAMAWEALTEEHQQQALDFIALFEGRLSFEEALVRYLREMDLAENIANTIRTRVLIALEDGLPASQRRLQLHDDMPVETAPDDEDEGWRRFRPDLMVRGVIERQKRNEENERFIELAIARAEESIIRRHIDNAITFAALLDGHEALGKAVLIYIGAIQLTGSRSQSVLQRTMAQLADVHLPSAAPKRAGPSPSES